MRKLVLAVALIANVLPSVADARSRHHPSYSYFDSQDYYTAASGDRVHRPVRASSAPAGPSAKCRDGSYSFSEIRRGTCSHHGGVGTWL